MSKFTDNGNGRKTHKFKLWMYRDNTKSGFIKACDYEISKCERDLEMQMGIDPTFTSRIDRINATIMIHKGYKMLAQQGIYPEGFNITED